MYMKGSKRISKDIRNISNEYRLKVDMKCFNLRLLEIYDLTQNFNVNIYVCALTLGLQQHPEDLK